MNLTQVAKITRREYIARVRTRAFVIVTILVPAFLVLMDRFRQRRLTTERATEAEVNVEATTTSG